MSLGRFAEPAILSLISLAERPRHRYAMMEDIRRVAGVKLDPGMLRGALAISLVIQAPLAFGLPRAVKNWEEKRISRTTG